MSTKKSQALWELCRQGFPQAADSAARCWEEGERFQLTNDLPVPRSLEALIDQCNWEIERAQEPA